MSEIRTYNAHELIQAKKHREEIVLKADHLAVVEAIHQRHEESMNQRISEIAALRAAHAEKEREIGSLKLTIKVLRDALKYGEER